MRWLFLLAVLAFLPVNHIARAQELDVLTVSAEPSTWVSGQLAEGCALAAKEAGGVTCSSVGADYDREDKILADVENAISKGTDILLISVGSSNPIWLGSTLQRAHDAGMRIVVVASGDIVNAAPLDPWADATLGVRTETLLDAMLKDVGSLEFESKFCVAFPPWVNDELMANLGTINSAMEKLGAKPAEGCPIHYESGADQSVDSYFRKKALETDASILLIPYYSPLFGSAGQPWYSTNGQKQIKVISAWPSPRELAYLGTFEGLKAYKGETVEKFQERPGVIMIGTDKYCEECDCEKDADCKSACPKCG